MTEPRPKWNQKADFFISCVGLSVGFGNIWRFPALIYRHGGGGFAACYFVLLLCIACPIFYMELSMGQFSSSGSLGIWRAFPMGKGVGVSMLIGLIIMCIYFNMISTLSLVYMKNTLQPQLPWTGCYKSWLKDTSDCYVRKANQYTCDDRLRQLIADYSNTNITFGQLVRDTYNNKTVFVPNNVYSAKLRGCVNASMTASEAFFWKYVLNINDDVSGLTSVDLPMLLCGALVWLYVYMCACKGIRSISKLISFTAIAPSFFVFLLCLRGVALDGSSKGLQSLIVPRFSDVLNIQFWLDCLQQVLVSLFVATGALSSLSCFNDYYNDLRPDVFFLIMMNYLWSGLSSATIFSGLGYYAVRLNTTVNYLVKPEFVTSSYLTFISFPESMVHVPFPQMWAFFFFVSIFLATTNLQIFAVHAIIEGFLDSKPSYSEFRDEMTILLCIVILLLGIPTYSNVGWYYMALIDKYFLGLFILLMAFFELVCFAWGYGVDRLFFDIEFMLNAAPNICWRISWAYIGPIALFACIGLIAVRFGPTTTFTTVPVVYPLDHDYFFLVLLCIVLIPIPLWAVFRYQQQNMVLADAIETDTFWGPEDASLYNTYHVRLRAKGFVPMNRKYPIRFTTTIIKPEPFSPSAAIPFAVGGVHAIGAPPNQVLIRKISRVLVNIPTGTKPIRPPIEPPTQEQLMPWIVRRPLPTVAMPRVEGPGGPTNEMMNPLGPQFRDSPFRFGFLGQLFLRKSDREAMQEEAAAAAITAAAPVQTTLCEDALVEPPKRRQRLSVATVPTHLHGSESDMSIGASSSTLAAPTPFQSSVKDAPPVDKNVITKQEEATIPLRKRSNSITKPEDLPKLSSFVKVQPIPKGSEEDLRKPPEQPIKSAIKKPDEKTDSTTTKPSK